MLIRPTLLAILLSLSLQAHAADRTMVPNGMAANNSDSVNNDQNGQASASRWSDTVQEVMMNALSLTGIRYTYGGKNPDTGFDCSGFVRYVFQQAASLTLPHSARAISQLGQSVSIDELQPGDLVFFNTLKTAFSHVGIYIGGHRFIHAPSTGGGISVVDMDDSYWVKRFNGAKRLDEKLISPKDAAAISAASNQMSE
ncbi:C40 family peptidase [Methyloradius palustris]